MFVFCLILDHYFHIVQTRLQNDTKLKKILQDSKESLAESEIRNRMQPLTEQLTSTVSHLHTIFETHVFIAICQGYWDRMGQASFDWYPNLLNWESRILLSNSQIWHVISFDSCCRMFWVSLKTGKKTNHCTKAPELLCR